MNDLFYAVKVNNAYIDVNSLRLDLPIADTIIKRQLEADTLSYLVDMNGVKKVHAFIKHMKKTGKISNDTVLNVTAEAYRLTKVS